MKDVWMKVLNVVKMLNSMYDVLPETGRFALALVIGAVIMLTGKMVIILALILTAARYIGPED